MLARDAFVERKLIEGEKRFFRFSDSIFSNFNELGFVFKKFHNFGNAKERHLRVTPDFKQIIWSTFPELEVKGSIDASELLDCVKRDSTASRSSDGYCFTMLGTKRNLELQAKTEKEREQWVAYFRYFLKFNSRTTGKNEVIEKTSPEKFFEPSEPLDLKDTSKDPKEANVDDINRKRKLLVLLLKGNKFTKHSKTKHYDRLFWVSLVFDQLLWYCYITCHYNNIITSIIMLLLLFLL